MLGMVALCQMLNKSHVSITKFIILDKPEMGHALIIDKDDKRHPEHSAVTMLYHLVYSFLSLTFHFE
jgi:hypothetical protein